MFDDRFAGWPLDEPAVLQSLDGWLRPAGRCLRIVGLDFEAIAGLHPKFARWRRDWTHRIEVWRPADGLLAPGLRLCGSALCSRCGWTRRIGACN